MSSSKLNSCFGVLSVLGFGIGRNPSWNCSGGGNMMSSLTLFHGMGLGFTLSHFPVLGCGVGFFCCFIINLINCPFVSFLRSFYSISILYGLVFKSLFSIPILYGLVFKPFLGRVTMFISIYIV